MSDADDRLQALEAHLQELTYRSDFQILAILEYMARKGRLDKKMMQSVVKDMKERLDDERFQKPLIQGAFDIFQLAGK